MKTYFFLLSLLYCYSVKGQFLTDTLKCKYPDKRKLSYSKINKMHNLFLKKDIELTSSNTLTHNFEVDKKIFITTFLSGLNEDAKTKMFTAFNYLITIHYFPKGDDPFSVTGLYEFVYLDEKQAQDCIKKLEKLYSKRKQSFIGCHWYFVRKHNLVYLLETIHGKERSPKVWKGLIDSINEVLGKNIR